MRSYRLHGLQEAMVLGLRFAVLSNQVLEACPRTNSSQRKISSLSKCNRQYDEVDDKVCMPLTLVSSLSNISLSFFRIDEQHMFHRARSEFLKLFYRAPDKIDAADPCLSQQLLPALSKRDFDAIRFCLFEQALQKSKMHVALLWLAFATLPGNTTESMFHQTLSCPLTNFLAESFVLKVLTENDTIISISSAFYDFLALSQSSSSIAVTKFQPR
jgi:hypothetical protein